MLLILFLGLFFQTMNAQTHFDGERFLNPGREQVKKTLWDLIVWQASGKRVSWPDFVEDNLPFSLPSLSKDSDIAATFVNHATVYLRSKNVACITDPVFSKRVSPFSWVGPKRHRKAGFTVEQMERLDCVVISHNHYDHMDIPALKEIYERFHPVFIVPLKNADTLEEAGIKNIIELDWWQSHEVNDHLKVTLTPAQHWSSRGLRDRNKSLWGGFVLQFEEKTVYFAGDTGYPGPFAKIATKFPKIDLSLLPIGSYEPQWFMKEQHLNPFEAVKAHLDLKSLKTMGIHYGTFQLTDEGIDAPLKDLETALQKLNISAQDFFTLKNGGSILF